jgi:hypothetical protein
MEKLAYSVEEVTSLIPLKKSAIYELVKSKELPARKLLDKTVIMRDDLIDFLNSCPQRSEVRL